MKLANFNVRKKGFFKNWQRIPNVEKLRISKFSQTLLKREQSDCKSQDNMVKCAFYDLRLEEREILYNQRKSSDMQNLMAL